MECPDPGRLLLIMLIYANLCSLCCFVNWFGIDGNRGNNSLRIFSYASNRASLSQHEKRICTTRILISKKVYSCHIPAIQPAIVVTTIYDCTKWQNGNGTKFRNLHKNGNNGGFHIFLKLYYIFTIYCKRVSVYVFVTFIDICIFY